MTFVLPRCRVLLLLLLTFLLVLPLSGCDAAGQGGAEKLSIERQDGKVIRLRIDVADTSEKRMQGLMYRESLDDDYGMLFVFEKESEQNFWMKNTLVPLDMIFIRSDGVIHHIHANAIPHDLSPIPSRGPALAVLEVRGGQSEAFGLRPGDRVRHKVFKP